MISGATGRPGINLLYFCGFATDVPDTARPHDHGEGSPSLDNAEIMKTVSALS